MPTRRTVLAATALGLASVAGCLDRSGDGDEQVADALDALPEPIGVEEPTLLMASDTDVAAIREARGPLTERDDRAGEAARQFEEQVDVLDLEDVERVAAVGAVETGSGATFAAATVEGAFDAGAITDRIEAESPELEPRTEGPFTWYVEPEDADDRSVGPAMFGISDRRIVFALGESIDVGNEELAGHVLEATTEPTGPLDDADEDLATTYDAVSGHHNASAASIDPDQLDGQPGTPPELQGLTALGLGTTPRSDGLSLEVVVRFRSESDVDADALASLWAEQFAGTTDDPVADAVELEPGEGPTVRATADVDEQAVADSEVAQALSLPVPWLSATFVFGFGTAVSTGSSGTDRAMAPAVTWDIDPEPDGRLEITHAGGDSIEEPVEIVYHTGEGTRREVWDPEDPITAGDSYTIQETPETGTDLRIVWLGEERQTIGLHTAT